MNNQSGTLKRDQKFLCDESSSLDSSWSSLSLNLSF
jgi:hypothetical protein